VAALEERVASLETEAGNLEYDSSWLWCWLVSSFILFCFCVFVFLCVLFFWLID
jgi:hypothetical protein